VIALARARRGDALLVALTGAHAAVLMAAPTAPVIAIGLWWNANTISHGFIHRPFFRHRSANRVFAAFLSVMLGFPHALWRDWHLGGYDVLADAGDIGGNHNSSFGVDEPATVTRMLQWIDAQRGGRPFFLTYLPIAGHHPYETSQPGPFPEPDEFGRYRNALHDGDASLGAFMQGLQARGLAEHTLWIVFGDHGEAFGQHEGNYGHTFNLYDENVHVPMLIAAPGLVVRQVRSRRVVSLVDVAPTVLDLAGLPAPEIYQGQSMLAPGARMALFFADYSLRWIGLRDGSLKVIHALDSGRSSLFDLDADPGERVNLADRHSERVRWYVENLKGWSAAQKQRFAR
jgi:arylsulfatase A-like enzyme